MCIFVYLLTDLIKHIGQYVVGTVDRLDLICRPVSKARQKTFQSHVSNEFYYAFLIAIFTSCKDAAYRLPFARTDQAHRAIYNLISIPPGF